MSKITWRGSTLLAPVPPAMVSCGTADKPNIITAAWTGIINSDPPKTYVSIRPERYSHELIEANREFVINLTPSNLVRSCDKCGMFTGRKVDKFKLCHLTPEPSADVSCPAIAECPVSLECRVSDIVKLGSHDMFIADIVAVRIDEKLLDEKGKLHLEKAGLTAYSHGDYFALGKKIGYFGFSVKKKAPSPQKKA